MDAPVLVVGSINMDLVATTERLPLPGETVLGDHFLQTRGGKGANQAVAAARSGQRVVLLGATGSDAYGEACRTAFEEEGIDTSHIHRDEGRPTGVALITVDGRGENCIVVAPGANSTVDRAAVEDAILHIPAISVCVCQLETPIDGVETALIQSRSKGAFTVLNPAPARELPDEVLRAVNCLTPNESETEMLTGIRPASPEDAIRAGKVLLERGVEATVITLGERGALLVDHQGHQHQPAPVVSVVDTTAAGDTFTGCLAASIAAGKSVRASLPYACFAASLSVTRGGAQSAIPTRAEIDDFCRRNLRK